MPTLLIDGRRCEARTNQTVLEVADANGFEIPRLCAHPHLSVAGNCRLCVVQVEGRSWVEIACNMPVSEGLSVLTDSELVRAHRKATLQFLTLNHPVDCGICDKAGECALQDYHVAHNGEASVSNLPKVKATKFYALSSRITLDNERCVLCTRCVRFTREISRSHALGVENRGDHSLIRPAEGPGVRPLEADAYSDNVIDLCPVGALLSRDFLYKDRVWYLKATPSVCPGCARGCHIDLWHRRDEWQLHAVGTQRNAAIARVTPRACAEVNGSWCCNKARDLAAMWEQPRATVALRAGREVALADAAAAAQALVAGARRGVALVSSAGSDEELAALRGVLGERFACFVKADQRPQPGEVIEDDLLIRADKNPNTTGARAVFGDTPLPDTLPADTDVLLVWGEGFDAASAPAGATVVMLGSRPVPANATAAVFIPLTLQTERRGHYTNFRGTRSAFERCFAPPPGVIDAQVLFAQWAAPRTGP